MGERIKKRLQRSFTDDSFPKYQISFRLHRTSKAKQMFGMSKLYKKTLTKLLEKDKKKYLSVFTERNYVCLRYGIDHCTILDEMILAVINLCWWLNQYGQSKEKSTSGRKPEKDIQLLPVLILKNTQYIFTGASKPVNSELFTHLGGKANQPKCTSKLSLKKTKTDTDKHRFTETKSKENISENKTGFGEVIDITSPQKEKEIITSPVFKKTNTNIKTCDKEPTVIPETQYFISPVTPTCKSRGDNKTVNSPSDDLLIIPDTPEDSTSEFGKKRKNFSRSFLIGSSSLGRRPGQKITPDHSKKTKKILHKKKNLISVSVNFNQSSEKLHSETSITKEEDSTNDYTEKSPEKFTDFCEDPNESFKEKEEKELQSPEKISEDSVKDTENLWHVDIDSDNSKNSENVEGDTPVKFNDSNSKFKRMSKPGLSPAAKKVNSQSNLDTADESDTTMTETKSPELEKEKVKRVLSLGVSNKRKLKSSNTSKLNAYQMSMNISNKKKNATDIKHVNLEDDDVLGEILQELKQTPKSTIVVSKGKSSKSPSVFTKNKDSLSSNRHKSLDHFDQSLTEEEMNYFSELDNQLHTKCITEENTSKQVVKEYPLLAYVKCTKYPEKTKNPTKKKKELSDKKGLNLAPDNKNLDKNSLKLAPDENNFDGNSMNLTPDDRESYLPCSLTSSAVIRNDDVECKIEECDTSRTVMIEGVVCDTSDILTSSCDVNKLEPTQNINEFSSQKSLVSSATDKGHSEMEIDEYNTQLDSQELCSEFKCLSPFKIRPEDDPFRMEPHCRQYGRHMVTNVEYTQIDTCDGGQRTPGYDFDFNRLCYRNYKILSLDWILKYSLLADTHIQEDDIVHIVAKTDDQGNHKITDTDGLIIVNPDLLLSGTTVVSSVFCMRKSILNEKFKKA
ncbi:hypothetical protein KUTeg_010009 [Tegillarca granosa]|uniref:DNA replication factor Dna2 N-terminal domain-containing protein n=1 Tax=Tegillarca granosa TaxID=220873 RepID=A0ABQ9F5I8_TEGGR|nr:hypothetical protein KUTeg_010009 [Tegillarca granosa]